MQINIRWLLERDIPAVLDIEHSHSQTQWTQKELTEKLRQKNVIGMVAENNELGVLGYMVYELMSSRINLLNLATHEKLTRKNIGKSLILKLISKLNHKKRTKIAIELRETNLTAQLFFRSMGFKAIEVLRNYYDDTGEDAFVMQYLMPNKPDLPQLPPPDEGL